MKCIVAGRGCEQQSGRPVTGLELWIRLLRSTHLAPAFRCRFNSYHKVLQYEEEVTHQR